MSITLREAARTVKRPRPPGELNKTGL
jgi:hypothetical protein